MKRLFLLVIGVALAVACGGKKELPPDVLTPQQMGDVLADITLAESWVENYTDKKANAPRDSAIAREVDKVLAIHKVDKERFRKSWSYYKSNPTQFRDLLDSTFHQHQNFQQRIFSKRNPLIPVGSAPPPGVKSVPVQ